MQEPKTVNGYAHLFAQCQHVPFALHLSISVNVSPSPVRRPQGVHPISAIRGLRFS